MSDPLTPSNYQAAIGIECHVQLKTKTKLFSAVGNDARQASPNTLVSHIDFGLPGALPVLNEEVVRLASRAAFIFGTTPQLYSEFERKHYFYPDLPMGYQISQLQLPIIIGGNMTIKVDSQTKKIRINRVQIEADAGKNTHPDHQDYSLVDLNRSGTPLLEIVSEPDLHSANEAKTYVRELYLWIKSADISDCDLYHGNMRFDVNVSVSKVANQLGTRTETKNLNSFRAVEKTVEYEINRQIELLETGHAIIQETRGWDDAKQRTISQRGKEESHDYRYMPDPDLPPIVLTNDYIERVRSEMPVMPNEWRKRLESLELEKDQVELLLEAEIESENVKYFDILKMSGDKELNWRIANWLVNIEIPLRRLNPNLKLIDIASRARLYNFVYQKIKDKQLSSTQSKELIERLLNDRKLPEDLEQFASQNGFIQISAEEEISKIVQKVIATNQKAAQDVKNGEAKAIGFLVGQVMSASQGKANPQLAQQLIKKELLS